MSVITEQDAQEVLEGAWSTMLDFNITPVDNHKMNAGDYFSAEIKITGAWTGTVCLRASIPLLSHAASVMFDASPNSVDDADRVDTLSELTNMLGGTMKCLLPEPSELSLPERIDESKGNFSAHEWFSFTCNDMPLAMAVVEGAEGAQAAA